jgi:hypothetical protein
VGRLCQGGSGEREELYGALVDRLLASPHYGERWGRHWLDQARYADTNGYTIDGERVMWPYRDWVIRALNEDLAVRPVYGRTAGGRSAAGCRQMRRGRRRS